MMDQYTTLLELLPDIEGVLKKKGAKVPRPEYGKKANAAESEVAEAAEDSAGGVDKEDEDDEDLPANLSKGKLDRFKMKQNHEATSDEDEA